MDRASAALAVTVVYSPRAREVDETALTVAAGSTVRDALQRSGLLERHPEIDLAALAVGIWGRTSRLDRPLQPDDRIEVYRSLVVEPKEARRLRARRHRAVATNSSR